MIEELDSYPVQLNQDLIWGDMDAFQHINNSVFFRYFEDVRMLCFEKAGVNSYMQKHNIGPILARTEADFMAPLIYPDTITIGARIVDVHEKKFTMLYRVYSHKLERIAADGSGLIVYYDYTQAKSCPIPDTIRKNITEL